MVDLHWVRRAPWRSYLLRLREFPIILPSPHYLPLLLVLPPFRPYLRIMPNLNWVCRRWWGKQLYSTGLHRVRKENWKKKKDKKAIGENRNLPAHAFFSYLLYIYPFPPFVLRDTPRQHYGFLFLEKVSAILRDLEEQSFVLFFPHSASVWICCTFLNALWRDTCIRLIRLCFSTFTCFLTFFLFARSCTTPPEIRPPFKCVLFSFICFLLFFCLRFFTSHC